jgi:hypothetical protein
LGVDLFHALFFNTSESEFNMSTLMQASHQWATRPAEERFTSLLEMRAKLEVERLISAAKVVSSKKLRAVPAPDNQGLLIEGPNGHAFAPTNWAFGQASNLIGAPARYLRELPAPLAADCINWGLQVEREALDVGVLLSQNGDSIIKAVTGPNYGRVWDADVVGALVERFGDGVSGQWKVPGEFGRSVPVTRENTTLYSGDRDMFVFLCDEENRIELPNRRDGKTGELARGFFISNSQVGGGVLRVKTFLFDYVCSNRIVWGALELDEIRIRHTASAPDKFVDQVTPALLNYSRSSAANVTGALRDAQAAKLEKASEFLAKRFGPRIGEKINAAHVADEGRPVETVWDAVTAVTAYAREIPWTNERVELEEKAGDLLELVS